MDRILKYLAMSPPNKENSTKENNRRMSLTLAAKICKQPVAFRHRAQHPERNGPPRRKTGRDLKNKIFLRFTNARPQVYLHSHPLSLKDRSQKHCFSPIKYTKPKLLSLFTFRQHVIQVFGKLQIVPHQKLIRSRFIRESGCAPLRPL